ncbi:ribose 5-phosphate isomerase B [Hypericibacter sp.]|uniref:ribose 5-phosphate isomerase B n=1 Tax=Hypericibacter sp. TaxID=2705401 RepID=UPI003D6D00D0
MPQETIAIAADHAGFELKELLKAELAAGGYKPLDLGTAGPESVDYPDFADKLAVALKDGRALRGVLVCGTGIGISIAANRHRHIRAAVCHDGTSAKLARLHNNANVLALGARLLGPEVAKDCLAAFLATAFEGGERHSRRIGKLS